ncbi:MAG: hypothetical protein KGZ40_04025 [Clostridiales bacterium]|nr:hypothetical protein [Clostridiales bacterium]
MTTATEGGLMAVAAGLLGRIERGQTHLSGTVHQPSRKMARHALRADLSVSRQRSSMEETAVRMTRVARLPV